VNTGTNFLGTQGGYDNALWVNPQAATFVVVGGIDLWRTADSGTVLTQISRWQCAPQNSAHADHHVIVAPPGFDDNTNRTVFFGNDGGIYRADDIRGVFQQNNCPPSSGWANLNNNLGITQFYGAAASNNGVIIAGAQDNGTARFLGNVNGWTRMFDGDGGYCAADPMDPNFFYGEYTNLTIYRSNNGGQSAGYIYCDPSQINPGANDYVCDSRGITDAANGANFIAPFVLDPNDPNTLLAGGLSLWRTANAKATPVPTPWTVIKQPATPLPPAPGASPNPTPPISAIAVSSSNSDLIVVGHNDGQIYLTFSGTGTSPSWNRIDNGTPARFVTRVVIDDNHFPNWIYATFGGFSPDNIYRSTNFGNTWTDITGTGVTGLPNVPVRGLTYHPRNSNFLYAGTEIGIFTSEDAGATWEVAQNGPANVSVDELFWLRQGPSLYATDLIAVTHGRGLYKSSFGIYVDCNFTGTEHGTITEPYKTITAAINATTRYQTIWIRPCNYFENFIAPPINKGLEMRTLGQGTVRIGGP
jgi:hypothetical protein